MTTPVRVPATEGDLEGLRRASRRPGVWSVKVWPTCGEASVTFVADRGRALELGDDGFEYWREVKARRALEEGTVEDSAARAVRRARSEVRRYSRHNSLAQMVTFTFAGEPPELESLSAVVHNFWKRFERRTGVKRGPYVWVPEWGKVSRRLHIHMAVRWWRELNCVEVCPACDRYDVLSRAPRGVPGNYFCVGCCWGLGFVGRPLDDQGAVETNEDGRSLSRYLSKYMAKDLGSELTSGQQRYRVAQGYQPYSLDEGCDSPDEGISFAMARLCDTVEFEGRTPILFVAKPSEGWQGPPVVLVDWLVKSPEREAQDAVR